ncbi:MAG: winged helix-turn-helix domain-containing protein [Patescibacteria group bacterium]
MLEDLLTSKVRVDMLKLLLRDPEEEHYVREITRAVDTEINAVRRELANLEDLGLVKKWRRGNRLYYKTNSDHPLYIPLLDLVCHESGLGRLILKHKRKLGKLKYAYMARALPMGRIAEEDEIDLVLIGEVHIEILRQYVHKAEKKHGHEINYTVLTKDEFTALKDRDDYFVRKLLTMPRIMLLGDEEDLVS